MFTTMEWLGYIGIGGYLLIALAFAGYVRSKEPSMSIAAVWAGALLWPIIEIAQAATRLVKRR